MLLAMAAFVLVVAGLSYRQLLMEENTAVELLQRQCGDRLALLDAATGSVSAHVVRMQDWANRYLIRTFLGSVPSPYYDLVAYSDETGYYGISNIEDVRFPGPAGNIFGSCDPHEQSLDFVWRFNLAADLLPLQEVTHEEDPRIVQSFYISPTHDVASVFPYSSVERWREEFAYTRGTAVEFMEVRAKWITGELPGRSWYTDYEAALGTDREEGPFWDWILDPFGHGMVVSCLAPVVFLEEYYGVVGADIGFDFFDDHLRPSGAPAGILILCNNKEEVLATSQGLDIEELYMSDSGVPLLEAALPEPTKPLAQELLDDDGGKLKRTDGYYIITRKMRAAPWTLVYIVSEAELAACMRPQLLAYGGLIALLIVFFTCLYLLILFKFIRPGLVAEGARARLAAIVEQSDDAIISESLDARIASWNTGAEVIFGYKADEAIGQPVSILLSPEQDGQLAQLIERISQGEQVRHFETSRRETDGKERHLSLSISPIRDAVGEIVGVSTIARDITLLKETEVELIRARTAAEHTSQAKSQFLANMSHELRTPLTAILGFSEMLLDPSFGKLNEEQVVFAERISGSGTHLLSLIDDLLDLAKIEAGKVEIAPEETDLAAVCREAAELMKAKIVHRGLLLELEVPKAPVPVMGDPLRLRQILLNLLSNAVKFTREGLITVWLREHADIVEFGVRDTGCGIAAENLPRLFKHYEQVHDQRTVSEMGTGLGLALCREIAEAHGATIHVESEVDQGSNFYVRLPRMREQPSHR